MHVPYKSQHGSAKPPSRPISTFNLHILPEFQTLAFSDIINFFQTSSTTMPLTTTIIRGPITSPPDNPIAAFYLSYGRAFSAPSSRTTTLPTNFYASTSILKNIDNSTISGAQAIWDYYIELYKSFEKVEHEIVSMTIVSDDESGKSTLFGEFVTGLVRADGKGAKEVKLPQAFVYEIREAEDGKGRGGLQIWEIRCYFDRGILREAGGV